MRPACCHHPRIFGGIGITNHHHLVVLNKAAIQIDVHQLTDHRFCIVQVI
ncbi:Uncharacterised protein [Vibrio cholerae]|nr:Uncharacterised protein [Vibrio cholerae]CSI54389.1 Uncharacterised protein [Vibrio cholerae]